MTTATKIGFYFELPVEEKIHTIKSLMREDRTADVRVVNYLESGVFCGAIPLIEEDPLVDPAEIVGPIQILTDGLWVWPNSLAYYVKRYHLQLPKEFVAHVELNGWQPPCGLDVSQVSIEDQGLICQPDEYCTLDDGDSAGSQL